MATLNRIFVENYRYFRTIFDGDSEALSVLDNLGREIQDDTKEDEYAHVRLQYWPHYDEEGLVGFEIHSVAIRDSKVKITCEFIGTAK